MALDFARLPKEYPRRFLPQKLDFGDWSALEPIFAELEQRRLDTREALETWLLDQSEFSAALFEEGTIRNIRMTCQTDNPEYEKAYLHFVEEIEPRCKPRFQRLRERYLQSPAREKLPKDRYALLDRKTSNAVEIFREQNVPLETQEDKLGQQYQKISGAMTVSYDGKEQTLQQMARYLEEPHRDVRHEAWELIADRRLRDRERIDELYDELIALRQQLAANVGFESYRDLIFRRYERFDYAPEDCFRFHEAVEKYLVPLRRELQQKRQRRMKLQELRPWDLNVDPEGRPPLRPFATAQELVDGCESIFRQVDPEFGAQFQQMAELGLLDLESRKGKAPGGYQATLTEHRVPFIFMNAVGRDDDVRTLLHEGGHAFHSLAARSEPLHIYRHAPIEFCEVASMGMELLASPYLEVFHSPKDAERSHREHLEHIVWILCWIATIDAFQHWIYTYPQHSHSQREEQWLELHRRFGGIESWEGYEDALRSAWQRQLHLFLHPFYYIEYGIAQLGALGVWLRAQKNQTEAVKAYRRALAFGGSKPLPELFQAAGLSFDFGPRAVARAAEGLGRALQLS
jgi:oligoendopeptidase F